MGFNFANLREELLTAECIKEYIDIITVMGNPYKTLSKTTVKKLEDFGISGFQEKMCENHKKDSSRYREEIIYGQKIIWEEFLNAYRTIQAVYERLEAYTIIDYRENYLKSTTQLYDVLNIYTDAKAAITILENRLGVDRYLDTLACKEFEVFVNKFDLIHRNLEKKMKDIKCTYIKNWNTTNVYDAMCHRLIKKNMTNQICSLLPANKKRIILFVIDGFGMGQYLWSKKVVPINRGFTYNENIFKWLSDVHLSDEFILGASVVTDTAAGISQIFIGKTAKDTRIFSSNLKRNDGSRILQVKSLSQRDFLEIADTGYNSFTVDISSEKEQMKIFYCSRYDVTHDLGFSKYMFDSAEVQPVIPPERVFSFLKNELKEDKTGAIVVYITSLDNSGHTMGSFSQFERYEHEKINMLFKNCLIELAKNNPEVFDGNTSIMLTADHGMTESYRINITRQEILNELKLVNESAKIIEDNRALLLYGLSRDGILDAKECLRNYFEKREIDVLVLSKGDTLFDDFLPSDDARYANTTPDLILLLISEGLFYSKNIGESLMHFGGHGGHSLDEVFVPFINIELNKKLLSAIQMRFLKLD